MLLYIAISARAYNQLNLIWCTFSSVFSILGKETIVPVTSMLTTHLLFPALRPQLIEDTKALEKIQRRAIPNTF